MRNVILWRGDDFEDNELSHAEQAGFFCTKSRMHLQAGDVVVGRYSCLPFYGEQEYDLSCVGAKFINSFRQHNYIADLSEWYADLGEFTPRTWFNATEIPTDCVGPFFVKGATNSKKFQWKTHAFAATRGDIGRVIGNLFDDTLISQQKICIREFEPLLTLGYGVTGYPVTLEYRIFVAYGDVVSSAYYWSSNLDDLDADAHDVIKRGHDKIDWGLVADIITRIGDKANAYTIDLAMRADGRWRLIELNDLQLAGLSENKPEIFYANLYRIICGECQKRPNK